MMPGDQHTSAPSPGLNARCRSRAGAFADHGSVPKQRPARGVRTKNITKSTPSLRYQKAQAEKRAATAAARAAARPRQVPGIVAAKTPPSTKEHDALIRDLLTVSERHLRDGNRRTAHCLAVAARVIAELQAQLDAHA